MAKIYFELSARDVDYLLIPAIEQGAIAYWHDDGSYTRAKARFSRKAGRYLSLTLGGPLESGEKNIQRLVNAKTIAAALSAALAVEDNSDTRLAAARVVSDIITENGDSNTTDCAIQLVAFGRIVYA